MCVSDGFPKLMARVLLSGLALFFVVLLPGQTTNAPTKLSKGTNTFWAPELLVGPHLHIYPDYPETNLTKTFSLGYGRLQTDANKAWAAFYGKPFTGIAFSVTDFGNEDVFGYGFSLLPYITFHTRRITERPGWHLHLGLGAAYYTQYFDSETNPTNESVGGPFSWSFQLGIYRDIWLGKKMRWQLGGGWLHGSNGHTRLPNFGINSFSFGVKALFFKQAPIETLITKPELSESATADPSTFYWHLRLGFGAHELGGPSGPVDGPTYPIYGAYVGASKIVKRFIRIRAGLGYRYYESYYDYITENQLEDFIDQPRWKSSNLYVAAGAELLMGHVTLDVELGTNLYKPFFKTFFDIFEDKSDFDRTLKSLILQRLGLYYYLWDTTTAPNFNIGLGCHINANNGQADFTGLSLMLVQKM